MQTSSAYGSPGVCTSLGSSVCVLVKDPMGVYLSTGLLVKDPMGAYLSTGLLVKGPMGAYLSTGPLVKDPMGAYLSTGLLVQDPMGVAYWSRILWVSSTRLGSSGCRLLVSDPISKSKIFMIAYDIIGMTGMIAQDPIGMTGMIAKGLFIL